MRTRKFVILCLGALAVVAFACVSYAKWKAYATRRDADMLLSQLRNLRAGESTFDDVQRIAEKHHRFSVSKGPPCSSDVCYFDFLYTNSLLARLGLASRTEMGIRVQVYKGRVDAIIMDLVCGVRPNLHGVYIVDGSRQPPQGQPPFEISNIRGETTWVHLTPAASTVQRDRSYSLDLKCFDHLGACRSKADLLPTLADQVVAH